LVLLVPLCPVRRWAPWDLLQQQLVLETHRQVDSMVHWQRLGVVQFEVCEALMPLPVVAWLWTWAQLVS